MKQLLLLRKKSQNLTGKILKPIIGSSYKSLKLNSGFLIDYTLKGKKYWIEV